MSGCLQPVAEVVTCIERGDALLLAGEAALLDRLPAGNWIGGTVPCLVDDDGGTPGAGLLHVTTLPHDVTATSVRVYDAASVRDVYSQLDGASFGVVIIPAASPTHLEFALRAPSYRDFAVRPLVGWISGAPVDASSAQAPAVYCGHTGRKLLDGAVVLQVTLPAGQAAEVGVVNVFEQGDGPAITFPQDGFDVTTAFVDGVETNLAHYVRHHTLDTRLPLVADFYGQMVNVSFRAVDPDRELVQLYSPVFAGHTYRHARPVDDYTHALVTRLPAGWPRNVLFSCNCILNHFYSDREGRRAQRATGPLTFGEVAYQLLNQTMVHLTRQHVAPRVR
jgi:hypothetical protein